MAKKAKIIIIGPGHPYRNGQSIYLTHLCNKLESDFDIELINYSLLYPNFLFPGKTQYDESSGQKIFFPNKRMVNSLNPLNWIKVARYINNQDPDIVAFDWWHPFFGPCHRGITSFLNKKLKKRVLFITENVISHEANSLDKLLTRWGLKHAGCFLALSESVEKYLQTMFRKKIFRSALPIYDFYKTDAISARETDKAQFGFNDQDIVLLFFGLVRKYKGLDLLLEAFAQVSGKHNNVKLLVVGEFYEDPQPYLDLINKLQLNGSVHLENRYVPNEEVDKYFSIADCVVLPYRSATQSGILSMAYGFHKPVVVTAVGELPALVEQGKTGYVVAKPDVQEISNSIEEFIDQYRTVAFSENISDYLARKDIFQNVNSVFEQIVGYIDKGND